MSDIKSDFKKWLQEHFGKSTAYSYYGLMQKIFDKNFDDGQDWQKHSENIMPLLARYFEFANREYKLDRITIWYALDYFDKIASYIQFGHLKSTKSDVDINIFDGDKNYFVCSTNITQLYDNVVFIQRYLFGSTDNLPYNSENVSIDALRLVILLSNIKETGKLQNLRDAAIYIVYNNLNKSAEKTALSRYCDFMYALTSSQTFDYKNNHIMNMVAKENPDNMIGDNYDIIQPITGKLPLQIKIKDKTKHYDHDGINEDAIDDRKEYIPDFILIVRDMVNILHIDRKSVVKHFVDKDVIKNMKPNAEKIYGIAKDKTVLRTYFSISSTNEFLKEHHHSVYKKCYPVNYNKKGYDYWIRQSEAIRELAISRNAFHNLVIEKNCSYLDYIKEDKEDKKNKKNIDYKRYYIEDIKYLKATYLVKEA